MSATLRTNSVKTLSVVTNAAAGKSLVISAVPANLLYVCVKNVTAAAKFVQLYNTAAVPADAQVPYFVYDIASSGHLVIDMTTLIGCPFSTGICIASSSTAATKTLTATDDLFITAIIEV
jgi:hypothetical protein